MDRLADIEQHLKQAFQPDSLDVHDESAEHIGHAGAAGGGGHFSVTVVSKAFHGHSALQRHRMVYQALADLQKDIHALRIRALTPDEL